MIVTCILSFGVFLLLRNQFMGEVMTNSRVKSRVDHTMAKFITPSRTHRKKNSQNLPPINHTSHPHHVCRLSSPIYQRLYRHQRRTHHHCRRTHSWWPHPCHRARVLGHVSSFSVSSSVGKAHRKAKKQSLILIVLHGSWSIWCFYLAGVVLASRGKQLARLYYNVWYWYIWTDVELIFPVSLICPSCSASTRMSMSPSSLQPTSRTNRQEANRPRTWDFCHGSRLTSSSFYVSNY